MWGVYQCKEIVINVNVITVALKELSQLRQQEGEERRREGETGKGGRERKKFSCNASCTCFI